jgi:hypothetical protein
VQARRSFFNWSGLKLSRHDPPTPEKRPITLRDRRPESLFPCQTGRFPEVSRLLPLDCRRSRPAAPAGQHHSNVIGIIWNGPALASCARHAKLRKSARQHP